MSGRCSVWIMWTGNCRDILRSAETFQSLAPFSSFMLGFFCFLTGLSPSLRNWIMGSLAVMDCWFAVSHCALNNSFITSNTLLCRHVYIWSECGHADTTWRKLPRSLLHDKHRSELVYPHKFRLVAFGKRSWVERRRNDIASGSIAINDFHDNLIGSISFHFVQAHCLAWVTALAFLCSSSNILTSSLTMTLFPFWSILKNTFLLVLPSPARLVWVTPMMSLIRRLHSPPGRSQRLTTSYLILFLDTHSEWSRRLSPSSSCEGILSQFWILLPARILGTVGFQNWYINPLSKNKEEFRATYAGICCYTVGSVQHEISQSRTSVRATKDGVADHVSNTKPSSFRVNKFYQLI